jgi:hypothetical protein
MPCCCCLVLAEVHKWYGALQQHTNYSAAAASLLQ